MKYHILGWSDSMNKWRDSNRVSHLIIEDPKEKYRSKNACGSKVMTYGSVWPQPPTHPCATCLRVEKAQAKAV